MEHPATSASLGATHDRPTPPDAISPVEARSPASTSQLLSPDHAHTLSPVQRVASLLSPGSRSRTSSRVKKGGRPGTAAVPQPSRPSSAVIEPALRRTKSLDDTILPSHRARRLSAGDHDVLFPILDTSVPQDGSPTASEGSPSSTLAALPCASDTPPGPSEKHVSENWLRLWHMFMELLVTERDYLYHLRVLVLIYLDQLPKYVPVAPEELEVLARNSKQILTLHESLAIELSRIELVMRDTFHRGSPQQRIERLGKCLADAADVFISAFMMNDLEVYDSFCAGHTDALEIVRSLQSHPDWDTYETRCSILATGPVVPEPAVRRRYSAESIRTTAAANHHFLQNIPTSRLKLMDILIKPVQRICKYPLMLAQIRQGAEAAELGPTREADPCGRLELFYAAMQTAARRVDEARNQKEQGVISRFILLRMESHPELTQEFLASLGVCMLSGSLEVVYHHSVIAPLRSPTKARYYGAFLYQGYIILVKVKKGRVYEPRHWFPMHQIEFHDLPDSVSMLPNSFRISSGLHHFDLGTRTRAEKEVWLEAIAEARVISSLRAEQLEPATTLLSATNASQMSLETDEMGLTAFLAEGTLPNASESVTLNDFYGGKAPLQRGGGSLGSSTKRRSSLFSTESSVCVIRHPASAHRLFVDKNLVDVLSNACLKARATGTVNDGTQLVVGRSKSWGKATNVLGRTPSVASVFHRRSATVTMEDGSLEEGVSRRSSYAGASDSPTRSKLVFPPVGRRRRLAGGPTLTIPPNDADMAEVDENRSEGAVTPDSSAFPLTPEAPCFHDSIPVVTAPAQDPQHQQDSSFVSNSRLPSPPSGTSYKHSRTKSHGSRGLLLSNRPGSLAVADELLRPSLRITPLNGNPSPSALALEFEPNLRDGEPVARSLLQRGMAYVLRRRTASVLASEVPRAVVDLQTQPYAEDRRSHELQAFEAATSRPASDISSNSWRRTRVRSAPLEATLQNAAQ